MRKSEKILETIYSSALKFLVPLTPQQAYSSIVKEAIAMTRADYGSISLRQNGKFKKVYSTSPLVLNSPNRPNANTYKAFKEQKPFIAPTSSYAVAHPNLVKLKINCTAFVPLSYHNKAIGVLTLNFKRSNPLKEKDLHALQVYGSMASLAIQKAQLYTETKRALEMRNSFISLIAHELRTPLTSISGYVQLLNKKQKDKSTPEAKWLEETYSEVMRLGNLINEVLEANRIETKKQQFYLDNIHLSEVIDKAIAEVKKMHKDHTITFENAIQEEEDLIIGDREKLAQVVISLLDNAAKFSEPEVPIMVTLSESNKHVQLIIEDLGKGIEKNELTHVFEGFYKGANNHKVGMGLGLLIAKNTITHHRGKITLESLPNQGTTVTITIPKATI